VEISSRRCSNADHTGRASMRPNVSGGRLLTSTRSAATAGKGQTSTVKPPSSTGTPTACEISCAARLRKSSLPSHRCSVNATAANTTATATTIPSTHFSTRAIP
jgi:hypothetical protein